MRSLILLLALTVAYARPLQHHRGLSTGNIRKRERTLLNIVHAEHRLRQSAALTVKPTAADKIYNAIVTRAANIEIKAMQGPDSSVFDELANSP